MPKYLIKGSYNAEGVRGVAEKGGTARREAIEQLMTAAGGSLECFYFAFGGHDVYVIGELPDNSTAAAIALTVNASGAVAITTDVLLTPEEVDAAAQKSIDYRPPGS